jgi:hypothetical protein
MGAVRAIGGGVSGTGAGATVSGGAVGGGGRGGITAELSPTPRSLYILWDEYQNGIGGRKAARLFTKEEAASSSIVSIKLCGI